MSFLPKPESIFMALGASIDASRDATEGPSSGMRASNSRLVGPGGKNCVSFADSYTPSSTIPIFQPESTLGIKTSAMELTTSNQLVMV